MLAIADLSQFSFPTVYQRENLRIAPQKFLSLRSQLGGIFRLREEIHQAGMIAVADAISGPMAHKGADIHWLVALRGGCASVKGLLRPRE